MTQIIKLSKRLQTVASFLTKGTSFADIGSDHAYLPCYVCQSDPDASAIAGELNQGPFESAVHAVEQYGLTGRIEVRLGDGLSVIAPAEVEEVVIAGMGGTLIASILEAGKDRLNGVRKIVAQPNVDARSVREWLAENGYRIINETILEEKGHIYEIIAAEKLEGGHVMLNESEVLFGPLLLKEKSEVFIKKWEQEQAKLERVIKQMAQAAERNDEKLACFMKESALIKEVIES